MLPSLFQTRPTMPYLSIRDLNIQGKRVFIRVDFNVPLAKNEQGQIEITSDKRIKASLPTIQYALEQGAALILASHLGRPKGKRDPEQSLAPVAARLSRTAEGAGRDGAGLRRTGSRGDAAQAGRRAAAREPALPRRGRKERSRVCEAARGPVRDLRERRVRQRAPRPRLHGRHHALRRAEGGRPA